MRRLLLMLGVGLISWQLSGNDAEIYCQQCGDVISGRYIISNDRKNYCSRECFDQTLPKCRNCGNICRGEYLQAQGMDFCSEECVQEKLQVRCMTCDQPFQTGKKLPSPYGEYVFCMDCSRRPACLICERPLKKLKKLPNSASICSRCNVNIIDSQAELNQLFGEVKQTLQKKFNFRFDHNITLLMRSYGVDKKHKFIANREFGVYIYHGREVITRPGAWQKIGNKNVKATVRYENESCKIVVLDHLPRFKMAEVMAHELAHDYMQHRWFYINDPKIKEGFAELVAAEYNRATGNKKWNYRMENSQDKIYGDGYRLLRSWYKKGGWKEVYRRLDALNRKNLPRELR